MLQRKTSKPGKYLGKTTGWVHRASLKQRGVKTLTGCEYLKMDDEGLHIRRDGVDQVLAVDSVVVCEKQSALYLCCAINAEETYIWRRWRCAITK